MGRLGETERQKQEVNEKTGHIYSKIFGEVEGGIVSLETEKCRLNNSDQTMACTDNFHLKGK